MLSGMLKEQIATRTAQIMLNSLESADAAYEEQFKKGEAAGMGLVLQLPEQIIEQLEADIKAAQEAAENEGKS